MSAPNSGDSTSPETKLPRIAYVVPHTHWDREWYRTFHDFRVDLVKIVRQVLSALENDPDFPHFVLDGQSIILEDYLEIYPEDESRLRTLVEAGALAIGPWYVLPDEFLVSAEALVRNLLLGHQVAGRVGPTQRAGYMPDSFGHVAQMPQLLRRAGLDSFIYTRGNGDEIDTLGHEFIWRAPDGSEVLAINQCRGYCNAAGLGFREIWHAHTRRELDLDRAVEQVREVFVEMAKRTNGDIALLNNGCDHFPPQREPGRVLSALRESFPDVEFRPSSLETFVGAVRDAGFATARYEGELLGGRLHHILSGVWSARMYLKQLNDECQTMLAEVVEPLSAYVHFATPADDRRRREALTYPQGLLDYAWKLLLANHPHDSICGCSLDEVHRDMLPRFDGVLQTADSVLRRHLEHLIPTFARHAEDDRTTVLGFANPHPERRREVVERVVVLQPFGLHVEEMDIVDHAGHPVPFIVVDVAYVERFWGVDYRTELDADRQREQFDAYRRSYGHRMLKTKAERDEHDTYVTVQLMADVPALGHATYHVRRREDGATSPSFPDSPVKVTANTIENDRVRVSVHEDGTFDLEDMHSGVAYPGLHLVEDAGDVGDEYDFSPVPGEGSITSAGIDGSRRVVEDTGFRGAIEIALELELPAEVTRDRTERSADRVRVPVRTRVRITRGSPVVEVETTVTNRARDHRLRVGFPTPVATDTIVSDGHFQVHRRPIERPEGEDWVQPPPETVPQQDFSLVEHDGHGLALFNRGLPEISATRDEAGQATLWLTLLRAVGWLSRDDFASRRCANAGPTIPTPEAQCIGTHRFRYALMPYTGSFVEARVRSYCDRYRTPLRGVQGVADQHVPTTGGLLEKTSPATRISAIKRHRSRDTLVVRLYNLTDAPAAERLSFGRAVEGAWRVDLLETARLAEIAVQASELSITLTPHEIVTLEVALRD